MHAARGVLLHDWQESSAVAFVSSTGATHLVSAASAELLRRLQDQPEGVSLPSLIALFNPAAGGADVADAAPGSDARAELERLLASLAALDLVSMR